MFEDELWAEANHPDDIPNMVNVLTDVLYGAILYRAAIHAAYKYGLPKMHDLAIVGFPWNESKRLSDSHAV